MIIYKICNPTLQGNGYCANHSTGGSAYKIMTKKEIIKTELRGMITVLDGKYENIALSSPSFIPREISVVDLDKLAEFLAKHLDIKPEKLIN